MKLVNGMLIAGLIACGTLSMAGQQDFMLENQTEVEIHELYISSAAVDNWEENLIGADQMLPSGNEVEINFSPDEAAELWDIKVVDSEGTSITWERLKLTEITRVILKITDGQPVAEVETVSDDDSAEAEETEEAEEAK